MSLTNPLLNEDILPDVFKFLTLRDRKIARLVCKLWSGVCNCEKFTKKEAFFICNAYGYETVVDVLNKCERKSLNLKFDQSLIDTDSLLLWKTCGKRIESLAFHECHFRLGMMPQIFKLCVNLTEFHMDGGEFRNPREIRHRPPTTISIFLPKKKIIRPKLTTLRLKTCSWDLRSHDLRSLATAFPALRMLDINFVVDDANTPTAGSTQSPNFVMLLQLIETNFKAIKTLKTKFPIQHDAGIVDINLSFTRHLEGSCLNLTPLSLEPFFKLYKNITQIPYMKYCSSLRIDGSFRNDSVPDLTVIPRLIEANPRMEKLGLHYFSIDNVSDFFTLFAAIVNSQLKRVTLGISFWREDYTSEIQPMLKTSGLPVNNSVRRLKIFSNSESFSSLCLEYFGNIDELTAKPGNPDVIFKTQPNLKQLSLTQSDDDSIATCTTQNFVNEIKNLEFLEVGGTDLNLLLAYRFPNLKYFTFLYDDGSDEYDDSDFDFNPSDETSFSIGETDYSDATDTNEEDCTSETGDSEQSDDDDSVTSSEHFLSLLIRRLFSTDDTDTSYDTFDDYESDHWEEAPNENEDERSKPTLFAFLEMDLDKRDDGQKESTQDPPQETCNHFTQLFFDRLYRVSTFMKENAPNLEGFQFAHFGEIKMNMEVFTAFFKACPNFPKLRYLSINVLSNTAAKAEVKAEMMKYMPQCPSLRVVWFESTNCGITLYFNTVTKKLEFSDANAEIHDFKHFYLYER